MFLPLYIPLPAERDKVASLVTTPYLEPTILDSRLFCAQDKDGNIMLVFGPSRKTAQGMLTAFLNMRDPLPGAAMRDPSSLETTALNVERHKEALESGRFALCVTRIQRGKTTSFGDLFADQERRKAVTEFVLREGLHQKVFAVGQETLARCHTRFDGIMVYEAPEPQKNQQAKKAAKPKAKRPRKEQKEKRFASGRRPGGNG